MKTSRTEPLAKTAILALAEIKATATDFDRGSTNLFDALDAIVAAIERYQAVRSDASCRSRPRPRAA